MDSDNICSSACKEKGIPMYCFVEGILVRRAGVRRSSVLALKWALQISRAIAKDPARSVLGRVSHLSCLHELRPCISNAVTARLTPLYANASYKIVGHVAVSTPTYVYTTCTQQCAKVGQIRCRHFTFKACLRYRVSISSETHC